VRRLSGGTYSGLEQLSSDVVEIHNSLGRDEWAGIGSRARSRARSRRAGLGAAFVLVLAVVSLALPATAAAVVPSGFTPCTSASASGFYCGQVVVPVDRSGLGVPLTDTITLHVLWRPAVVADTGGAIFALAGGPGQAAIPFAADFAASLAPALQTRDLVVFDQRGTGASALDCPGAANALSFPQFIQQCAAELGPARSYYTSKDSALDIDAIRTAIGVDRVTIFGVSYGTYVAQLYARLFPEHTAALVLDSVVSATGVDAFLRSNFTAIPKVLAANCSKRLCRGITATPFSDFKRLVARTRAKGSIALRYVDKAGKVRDMGVSQSDLFFFMIEISSFDAGARARLPAAIRSTLAGDPYPLGRLFAPSGSGSTSNAAQSDTLFLATRCTEETFPWVTSDGVTTRRAKAATALSGIAASTFNPFSPATSLSLSDMNSCLYWPAPTVTVDPTVTAPPANVPVLILSGQEDDVTPADDSKGVAALFPQARRLVVPFTGHSVTSDVWPNATTCVERAISSFFGGGAIGSCNYVKPFFRPVKVDPVSLAKVKPVKLKGIPGQTMGAVLGTLSDVTTSELSGMGPATGLRGGFFRGSIGNLRLKKIVYVPGVVVSGRMNLLSGLAKVTVRGKGARGSLVIRRGKKITTVKGTLGGKRVSIRTKTSANDSNVATQLPGLLGLSRASRSIR
jgi:pimeloyl-ACP methyl ester carboxylesterase